MEKETNLHIIKREKNRFNIKLLVLKILAVLSIPSFIYILIIGDGNPETPVPGIILYTSLIFFLLYNSEDRIRGFLAKKRKN